MCNHDESKANHLTDLDQEIRQQNEADLKHHLHQLNFLFEDVTMCFETGLRMIRCANIALVSEEPSEEDQTAILEVLSIAEKIFQIGYDRYLLK